MPSAHLPLTVLAATVLAAGPSRAADPPLARSFVEAYCLDCHDSATKKGGLDLENLSPDLTDPAAFTAWVKVHDRVRAGEMPPAKKPRPPRDETAAALRTLDAALADADRTRRGSAGRAVVRRLNRTEYENTLRDLFDLPGLTVRDLLPEDGRAHGYDKSGSGLDVSHVQLAKYLEAADAALDRAIAPTADPPGRARIRLYPGAQYDFKIVLLNGGDAVFLKDGKYDPFLFPPLTASQVHRLAEFERSKALPYFGSVGVFRHEDESFTPRFSTFTPLYPGLYRLRLSVWGFHWDKGEVRSAGRTEAASLTAGGRLLGYFDAPPLTPTVHEVEAWLNPGEHVRFNAASLWPVRVSELQGRVAGYTGPGVAVDWLEVDGPIPDAWPPASHRRLFGDLPLGPLGAGRTKPPPRVPPRQLQPDARNVPGRYTFATVVPADPAADAGRLLADFLPRAFRRPVPRAEVERYLVLALGRLADGLSFEESMRAAYRAALCSPDFLYLRERPGRLDDWALASRLSYFLWGSLPDAELTALAGQGKLTDPAVLRAQVERMLADPKAGRFVADFTDQWLGLREIDLTSPDRRLYPEFGPYLRDSMVGETRGFFRELLARDLPVATLVRSDFGVLNQKLAEHYGVGGVSGSALRPVPLPADAHRGGVLTQAAVLKVTANGTTTSPVKRGAWVLRALLGKPPDPPPPDLPAVEPDVRGTTTIREQLDRHRSSPACAACHTRIDPPGFALESFDVIGGRRDRYRSLELGDPPTRPGDPHHGLVFYRLAKPVDPTGQTADGRAFAGIDEYRAILAADDRQLARNLFGQLLTYATGAPVGYADRAEVERALDRVAAKGYGVRSLVHEVVQSEAFRSK